MLITCYTIDGYNNMRRIYEKNPHNPFSVSRRKDMMRLEE